MMIDTKLLYTYIYIYIYIYTYVSSQIKQKCQNNKTEKGYISCYFRRWSADKDFVVTKPNNTERQ